MTLSELLSVVPEAKVRGPLDRVVKGLRYDSRSVSAEEVFFAWKGQKNDGHAFVPEACRRGSSAVVYESEDLVLSPGPTYVQVPRARETLARMADVFYGHPSRSMNAIGITGTNGKTTTAFVTKHLLSKLGSKVGLLGTVRYEIGDQVLNATRTTPEGSDLHGLLARMHDENCSAVVMEVSSHALDQGRVAGVDFNVAVWTNLTPDHLDYHLTMESYFLAKRKLFEGLTGNHRSSVAVINHDDAYFQQLISCIGRDVRIISYSAKGNAAASLRVRKLSSNARGTTFDLCWDGKDHSVQIPLLGRFNVENVVAAIGVLLGLSHQVTDLLGHLPSIPGVPGRLERFGSKDGLTVVVDYAHTPDALENVLQTLRGLSPNRIITVVGCGGDRDRLKRSMMAAAACRLSDLVVFTADNPRSETLSQIFGDMRAGVTDSTKVEWIEDRRAAISRAIEKSVTGDLVCVAGKGHEITQEIQGKFHPFDDRTVVHEVLKGRIE